MSPRGIYDRSKTQEVTGEAVAQAQETKPAKVRQLSTNKDHMGENEPLCHGCGHRSDMHYVEHRRTERRMAKSLQGDIGEIEVMVREKIYTGDRPCQHACLCKAYE